MSPVNVDDAGHYRVILEQVEPLYQDRFAEISALTDAFCDELTPLAIEYKTFARVMTALLCTDCTDGSPPMAWDRSKASSWAAGVVWTLGGVNFLTDDTFEPIRSADQVAAGFGVSSATMQSKATRIRRLLDIQTFDLDWTLPSLLIKNPLVWMAQTTDGVIVDLREAPREVQVEAFEAGIIPFVPDNLNEQEEGIPELENAGDSSESAEFSENRDVIGRIGHTDDRDGGRG